MSDENITKNGQNHSILDEVSMDESKINELIEKYDAESRYRKLTGLQGKFITAWLCAMSLFHLYTAGIATMPITIEMLYNEYLSTAAFSLAAVLTLLALITLLLKTLLEWRFADQLAANHRH